MQLRCSPSVSRAAEEAFSASPKTPQFSLTSRRVSRRVDVSLKQEPSEKAEVRVGSSHKEIFFKLYYSNSLNLSIQDVPSDGKHPEYQPEKTHIRYEKSKSSKPKK